MPTGYTACIKDGVSFEKFALGCARAFGALVMMRDDPSDAPIPEKFEPSDYSKKALVEIRLHLEGVIGMSDAMTEDAADELYERVVNERRRAQQERRELKEKYEAMLAKVRMWDAPTPDHEKLKEFMQEQIVQSIDWDCATHSAEPKRLTGEQWRAAEIEQAQRDIAYHTKAHAEEVARTESRNAWLSALRASLTKAAA